MKKILKVIASVSALILSLLGLTACIGGNNIAMYGIPSEFETSEVVTNQNINE